MRTTKIAIATPFEGAPKINLASVFGASAGKPFLLRIPVTGERPLSYAVKGLPEGLFLENNTIRGEVRAEGHYPITIIAENALGIAEKTVTLEIEPEHLLLTPLLGFTTWNAFGSEVTQQDVEHTARKLVETGIAEYGYQYVNLDSGWQHQYGGEFDAVMPNPKFPDMKAMTDNIHALGFKCGIYSTPMLTAWGCPKEYPSIPGCTVGEPDHRFATMNGGIGVIRKEKNNVRQWDAWGFDYLKYDWKPTDTVNADLMREALLQASRDFGFCVTVSAMKEYHNYWSKYCNSYRSGPDTHGTWENLLRVFRRYREFSEYVNKGHYFDLDMLDVGTCRCRSVIGKFTQDEQIVAYSLRAFLNSPIQLSSTLEELDEFELSLYCNEEIIAIHQDAAFSAVVPVLETEDGQAHFHLFEKQLEDGSFGYACFNLGEDAQRVTMEFPTETTLRDLWAKEDLSSAKAYVFELHPHTVRIFKSCVKLDTAR